MRLLKALLATIALFGFATFMVWLMTSGIWGTVVGFAIIFIAITYCAYCMFSE